MTITNTLHYFPDQQKSWLVPLKLKYKHSTNKTKFKKKKKKKKTSTRQDNTRDSNIWKYNGALAK